MANKKSKSQVERFREAARDADTDLTKEEFGRVIGGPKKSKPQPPEQPREKGRRPKTRLDGIT